MKKLITIFFLTFLFLITTNLKAFEYSVKAGSTVAYQGDTNVIAALIDVSGNETISEINLQLDTGEGDIALSNKEIEYVEIKVQSGPTLGSHSFSSETSLYNYTFSGLSYSPAGQKTIQVLVKLNKKIPHGVSFKILAPKINADSDEYLPDSTGVYSVLIQPKGINIIEGSVKNLIATENIGWGASSIPVLSFGFDYYQTTGLPAQALIDRIALGVEGDSNALLFKENAGENDRIVEIKIYHDVDQNKKLELSTDTLVGTLALPSATNDSEQAVIPITAVTIPNGGSKYFIAVLSFGNFSGGSRTSTLSVVAASDNANVLLFPAGFNGCQGPLPSEASDQLTVKDANVLINTIEQTWYSSLVGTNKFWLYPGHQKAQVLKIEINSLQRFANSQFTIKDSQGNLLAENDTAITRIWLYKDNNANGMFDSADTFRGSAVPVIGNTSQVVISNVLIEAGIQTFFALVDIGYPASVRNLALELGNIEAEGMILNLPLSSGYLKPDNYENIPVTTNIFLNIKKTRDNKGPNINPDTGTIQYTVTMNSLLGMTNTVMPAYSRPVFLQQSIKGTDISDEYLVSNPNPAVNFSVAATDTTLKYSISPEYATTTGKVYLDAEIAYKPNTITNPLPAGSYLVCRRYRQLSDTWISGADDPGFWYLTESSEYGGVIPAFLASKMIAIDPYGVTKNFSNGDFVEANSTLEVSFASLGGNFSSILIYQNGQLLTEGIDYLFDHATGQMTDLALGSSSGYLNFEITLDPGDQKINIGPIDYQINSGFEVNRFFVYPSPYNPLDGDLRFGFQMSKSADVEIYLYDAKGKLLWEKKFTGNSGYNTFLWNGQLKNGKTIASGVYLLLIKADDGDKEKIVKTKLGVL